MKSSKTPNFLLQFALAILMLAASSNAWWNASFGVRNGFWLNSTGNLQPSIYMDLNETYTNGSDIRLTWVNSSGDENELPNLWRETNRWDYTNASGFLWFSLAAQQSINSNYTYYVYYNNSAVPDISNGSHVFNFFDDFDTLNLSGKWNSTTTSLYSVFNGSLNASATLTTTQGLFTNQNFTNFTAEWRVRNNGSTGEFYSFFDTGKNFGDNSGTSIRGIPLVFSSNMNNVVVNSSAAGIAKYNTYYRITNKMPSGAFDNNYTVRDSANNSLLYQYNATNPDTTTSIYILQFSNGIGNVDWVGIRNWSQYDPVYSYNSTSQEMPAPYYITPDIVPSTLFLGGTANLTVFFYSEIANLNATDFNWTLYIDGSVSQTGRTQGNFSGASTISLANITGFGAGETLVLETNAALSNGTVLAMVNSSSVAVQSVSLLRCNATYNATVINYTIRDVNNGTLINSTFLFSITSTPAALSDINGVGGNYSICISPDTASVFGSTTENYVATDYYARTITRAATTYNTSAIVQYIVYLTPITTTTTAVQIVVRDQNYIIVPNQYVQIYQLNGTSELYLSTVTTNSGGLAIENLQPNSVLYHFKIVDSNGTAIQDYSPLPVSCNIYSPPCTVVLSLNGSNASTYITTFATGSGNCTWTNSTGTLSCQPLGDAQNLNLSVFLVYNISTGNYSSGAYPACNATATGAAQVSCVLLTTSGLCYNFVLNGEIAGLPQVLTQGQICTTTQPTSWGAIGVFCAFIVVFGLALLGTYFGPTGTVTCAGLGLLIVGLIPGMLTLTYGLGSIILGVALLFIAAWMVK